MFDLINKKQKDFFSPVKTLQNRIEHLFNNFFEDFDNFTSDSGLAKTFRIKVNIAEKENAYEIDADLAGIKKEDIELKCENKILIIKAEKKEETENQNQKKNYHRIESYHGIFQRSIYLPDNIDEQNITADFKDGRLRITIPKIVRPEEKSKPIKIK